MVVVLKIIGAAGSIASVLSLLVALTVFRRRRVAAQELQVLRAVPEEERAALVEKMFDRFGIATSGLGRAGKLKIAEEQMRSLSTRLRLIFRTATVLAVILGIVGLAALLIHQVPDLYEVQISVLDANHARIDGATVRATA